MKKRLILGTFLVGLLTFGYARSALSDVTGIQSTISILAYQPSIAQVYLDDASIFASDSYLKQQSQFSVFLDFDDKNVLGYLFAPPCSQSDQGSCIRTREPAMPGYRPKGIQSLPTLRVVKNHKNLLTGLKYPPYVYLAQATLTLDRNRLGYLNTYLIGDIKNASCSFELTKKGGSRTNLGNIIGLTDQKSTIYFSQAETILKKLSKSANGVSYEGAVRCVKSYTSEDSQIKMTTLSQGIVVVLQ